MKKINEKQGFIYPLELRTDHLVSTFRGHTCICAPKKKVKIILNSSSLVNRLSYMSINH
jgi:hypothetical protein